MSKLIQYKGVEICQEEQIVLKDVNIEVTSGEMVYLLGRVGTGKSSFMKTLYAEVEPIGVQAEVLGYDMLRLKRKDIPHLRRKVGVVFQDFQLLTDRSVEENLEFVLKATGWKDKQAIKSNIHDVLSQVGMENKAYKLPHQLSGGEQQRVCIARAIVNEPKLLICDEPTGNLDPKTSKEIIKVINSINKDMGTTVIMVTHDKEIVNSMKKRVITLENGVLTNDSTKGSYTADERD